VSSAGRFWPRIACSHREKISVRKSDRESSERRHAIKSKREKVAEETNERKANRTRREEIKRIYGRNRISSLSSFSNSVEKERCNCTELHIQEVPT